MLIELTGPLSDPEAAWQAVADTDWMNREAGNGKVLAMEVIEDEHGYPEIHGALSGPLGVRLPFIEDGNHWIRGRVFEQRRTYASGPLLSSRYLAKLDPVDNGVVPRITLELVPRSVLLNPVVSASLGRIRTRWNAVLQTIPAPGTILDATDLRKLGPVAREVYRQWAALVPGAIAERLHQVLRTSRPLELQQLRAFDLADRWGLDRDAVVEAFLSATELGLLELYWSVRCPRCQAQTASTTQLGNLADHARCDSCRIGFGADLTENVEVLFAPHPSMGERVEETFCTLFPMSSPSIEASVILGPGQVWQEQLPLVAGRWRLGSGGELADLGISVNEQGDDQLEWTPAAEGERPVRAGTVDLRLENPTEGRLRVQLARLDSGPEQVPASYLTTRPGFRRRLSDQVLAPDIRISARSVCLLFSDLTGSTAMYEELGDAEAFAVVRDHFRVLRAAIEAHQGTVVKTIGDAVMAAFHRPGRATEASLQMIEDFDLWVDGLGLRRPPRLTIGVHVGPALVVHSDASGLDYFGQTVNIAARTNGLAAGGELVYTEQCEQWPAVGEVLAAAGLRPERIEANLKGLSQPMRLYRVVVGKPDDS